MRDVLKDAATGGFVAQSSYSHEVYLRTWTQQLPEAIIVSVDYPTAPEAVYPTALESIIGVYRWCVQNQSSIGWGGESVVLVGDSAGANLAAGATITLTADPTIRSPGETRVPYSHC